MNWKDIGQSLTDIAPTIAQALVSLAPIPGAGLVAPLAAMAVQALESALGLEPGATPDTVSAALATTSPDTLLALRKADLQYSLDCRKADIDLETVFQKDRASAREREVSVRDRVPGALMFLITIGFFGLLSIMCFMVLPIENKDALGIMLGSLGTAWLSGVFYYFGSSAGSSRKDALLAKAPPTT